MSTGKGRGRKKERKGEKKTCLGPEHLSTIILVTLGVLVDAKHMTSLFPLADVIPQLVFFKQGFAF